MRPTVLVSAAQALTTAGSAQLIMVALVGIAVGLGAGVWTRDGNRAYRMGRGIKADRVWTTEPARAPVAAVVGAPTRDPADA
jgi:aldehyde dehydrogenase